MRGRLMAVAASALVGLVTAGSGQAAPHWGPAASGTYQPQAHPDDVLLSFSNGIVFDPLQGEPRLAPSLVLSEPAPGEKSYYLVQGHAPLSPAFPELLRAQGAEPLRYHSRQAYVVRADRETVDRLRGLKEVRWAGLFHPAYRLSQYLPLMSGQTRRVVISLFPDESIQAVAARIASLGATVLELSETEWNLLIVAEADGASFARLAAVPGVDWIEPDFPMVLDNEKCQWVIQTFQSGNRRIWDMGLTGEGQTVTLHDSGIYTSHCMFQDPLVPITAPGDYPTHRKVIAYKLISPGLFGDESGHGSHTSCTFAGNDEGDSLRDGMAKDAKIYFTDGANAPSGIYTPADLNTLYLLSYNGNPGGVARISSNSWGGPPNGAYTTKCQQTDQFMWNHKDYLICYSNGNEGPDGIVHPPGTTKDIISGGGTLNGVLATAIYASTSRGPTNDGRRKPTICAPATLWSARYNTACTFWQLQGTSMSTPALAGGCALIRQYLTEGWYPTGAPDPGNAFTPSAALLKAMAVNCADPNVNPYVIPDNNIGWGRMDLDNVLYFPGDARRTLVYDETTGLSTGQYDEYLVEVFDDTIPLKVALVWTDFQGNPAAGVQLVNDLHLEGTDGSATYLGSVYSGGESTTGGTADNLNVEECLQRNTPTLGVWTFRVEAATTPQGPQPYALVVTGGVREVQTSVPTPETRASSDLQVSHGPSPASAGAVIRYTLPKAGTVRLAVFDVAGRAVRMLVDSRQPVGTQLVTWDTRDEAGNLVPSGVYFYRLETPIGTHVAKMIVTR